MATQINRLTTRTVKELRTPGRHLDGGNLCITLSATGAKSWLFIYRVHGRQPELGLGGTTAVSLDEARKTAARYREMLAEGQNPASIHKRKAAEVVTFGTLADQFIDGMHSAWRNDKAQGAMADDAEPIRCAAPAHRGRQSDDGDVLHDQARGLGTLSAFRAAAPDAPDCS